jgi:tRNA(Ile2) C34 agmatinyltransferase TiaS
MLYIGLDDTDTLDTPGTGHHAREIAATLSAHCRVAGVTRHQLLVDPRVPCTKRNSSAAILVEGERLDAFALLEQARAHLAARCPPGSDPGLCIAQDVPAAVVAFAQRAKRELVGQAEARALAAQHAVLLVGLGGDEGGVIGALAAVGLAATGDDGRYVSVGHLRDLSGLQTIPSLRAAGVPTVCDASGKPVTEGLVLADKLRPARRGGRPVAVVERQGDHWHPLKLD